MADPRTFVLIGDFQDNITPALESINNNIAGLKRTMSTMTSKRGGGFSDVTQSVGRLVSAQKHLANSIKEVGDAAKAATGELKEYKTMVGKVASAHYHIARAGQQAGDKLASGYSNALTSLDKLDRRQKLMATANRRRQRLVSSNVLIPSPRGRTPRATASPLLSGGGGGGMAPPRSGSSIGGGQDFPMARFTLAFGMSEAISAPIVSAITTGFQIGTAMMVKPFEYFVGAFGERVQDELSDLKAAGGLLSISKRASNPFLKNIDEAIQFQQDTNETFAKMAASLPGVTNDYVQVGKRLSDTAARIVTTDFEKARQEANRIRSTEEGAKFYGSAMITGAGAQQQREVIETLLGELTKKTTIAGLGGPTRAGGIAGAYGLPGLTERMISQEQVSIGQFQRYASVFSDPTIADALQRNIEKVNATQMNTVDRYKAIQKLLDEIVTPELIEKLRTSVDGISQGFKATFFDPDTGLFGLGRNFKQFGKKLNQYGQYVNEAGEVVDDISLAANEDLSLFEVIRDIFSNLGQVLLPIAEVLPLVFDPLRSVASVLMDARHYAAEFNRTFNEYREGLKNLSEESGMGFLKDTLDIRAAMATINGFLVEFGAIGDQDFQKFAAQITSKDLNIGQVLSDMIDKLLDSDIAKKVGEVIGEVIGTVLVQVAQVTGFLGGRIAGTNKLFKGLKEGFDKAGGGAAFGNIFKDIFSILFKGLIEIAKIIPIEAYMVGALMFVLPLAIQTLAMALAHSIADTIFDFTGKNLFKIISPGRAAMAAGVGGPGVMGAGPGRRNRGGLVNRVGQSFMLGGSPVSGKRGAVPYMGGGTTYQTGVRSPAFRAMPTRTPDFPQVALPGVAPLGVGGVGGMYKAPGIPKRSTSLARSPMGLLGKVKTRGVGTIMAGMLSLSNQAPKLAKAGAAVTKIARVLPGGAIAFGAVDAGLRVLSGQKAGQAVGGAASATAGSMAGAALGSLIAPGIGTAIGGIAGGIIGDRLFSVISDKFSTPAKLQEDAAQKQLAASLQQLQAAKQKLGGLGVEAPAGAQGIADPLKLGATIRMLGLESDKLVTTYQQNVERARMLSDQTQSAKDALFSKVEELKKLGYDPALIWKQTDIQALQKDYTTLQKTLREATKSVDSSFKALPQHVSRAIVTNMQKMSLSKAEDVLAMKFANMKMPQFQFQPPTTNSYYPGATPPLLGYPPPSPGPSSGGVPNIFKWNAFGSPGKKATGLGAALAYENKHKPPGSKIVIANSSERIIPAAANGYIPSQSLYSRGYAGWDSSGEMTVNAPITINGAGQNAEEIAIRVADLLGDAIETARSRSLFG